jgi:hypothetical protein
MMNALLILSLALSATPQDVVSLAEKDGQTIAGTRYLSLHDIDEENREDYKSVVSFILNSLSKEEVITVPDFVDDEKLLIRFNIENYKIAKSGYDSLGVDKQLVSNKLNKILQCENPILRVEHFIVKALSAQSYYKLLGVKTLEEFRRRAGFNPKVLGEHGVVLDSMVCVNSQQIRRSPTLTGYIWEARVTKQDYLKNLLSEEFDSIQVLASGNNGLLLYFAADSKGELQESLDCKLTMDNSGINRDSIVRISSSCVACHASKGILPFKDVIRDSRIGVVGDAKLMEKLAQFYGADFPFKKDMARYQKSLAKATDMEPEKFQKALIKVFQNYHSDLTFKQVAKYLGKSEQELTRLCKDNTDIYWIKLLLDGKISRSRFNEILE